MGRYRKIDPRIHNDAKFKALSERGKLLFFTILTHPHMTALGAMRATEAGLCQEMTLGLPRRMQTVRQAGRSIYHHHKMRARAPEFLPE